MSTALETYIGDISGYELLTPDQELALARQIETGDPVAREQLLVANLRLVVSVARGFTGRGLSLADLIEEGNLGLMRAVEGYDPLYGTRFSTYATPWIMQSIRRRLGTLAPATSLPYYMTRRIALWRSAERALHAELGRQPTDQEVAAFAEFKPRQAAAIVQAIRARASCPGPTTDEDDDPMAGTPDPRAAAPDVDLAHRDEIGAALSALEKSDDRERTVLRLRFGLDGEPTLNLREIGEKLGLTRERVRQIQTEALKKLREAVAG